MVFLDEFLHNPGKMKPTETPQEKAPKAAPLDDGMPRRKLSFLDRSKLTFADLVKGITEFCRRDVVKHPWRAYVYIPFLGVGALTPLLPGPNILGAVMFAGLMITVKTLKFFHFSRWAERLDARIQESFDEKKLLRRYGGFLKPAAPSAADNKDGGMVEVQNRELAAHVLNSAKNNVKHTAPPWGQWVIRNIAAPVFHNGVKPVFNGLCAVYNKVAGAFRKEDKPEAKPPSPHFPS